ncbi:MAG: choice-of-anchor J domain-containing protein [Bacteroidales bacterium]|nr:choice-of-anchor J domain-containing protein [Bacteroidales bacterium]
MRKLFLLSLFCFIYSFMHAQVLQEGFETTFPGNGWTSTSPTSTPWEIDDGTTRGPGKAYSGAKALMFNNYDYSNNNSGIITSPAFDLSSYKNPQLSFFWWNGDRSSSPARVVIKTSVDGSIFTELVSLDVHSSKDWAEFVQPLAKDVVKIQIIGISDFGSKNTFIDDISIADPADYLFDASTANATQEKELSKKARFTISLENKGAENDTYNFQIQSSSNWTWKALNSETNAEITQLTVQAGQKVDINLDCTIPNSGIDHGHEENVDFKIISQGDNNISKTIKLKVLVIAPLNNPQKVYTFNFDGLPDDKLPLGWRIDNSDGNSNFWTVDDNCLRFDHKYNSSDDWVFSQPFILEKDASYRIKFKLKGGGSYTKAKLKVYIGESVDQIKASDALFSDDNFYSTSYVDNELYFMNTSEVSQMVSFYTNSSTGIYIDDIVIEKAPDYEVKLSCDIDNVNVVAGEISKLPIVIRNNGAKADIVNITANYKYPITVKDETDKVVNSISLDPQASKTLYVSLNIPNTGVVNQEKADAVINVTSNGDSDKKGSHKVVTTSYVNHSFPFKDQMESGIGNWIHETDEAVIANENSSGGSNYLHIKSSKSEGYDVTLNSFVDLKDAVAPVLEFDHNASIGSYDKFKVRVKVFGEDSFEELEGEVYTGTPAYDYTYCNNAFGVKSFDAWKDVAAFDKNAWQHALFDLKKYKGKRVIINFQANYGSYIGLGWLLDNVAVKEAPEYIFITEKKTDTQKAATGNWVEHTFTITNKGSKADTYELSSAKTTWPVKFYNAANTEISEIQIPIGESKSVTVKTQVAADAAMGFEESAELVITSKGDNAQVGKVMIKTIAIATLNVPYVENFDNSDSKNLLGWVVVNANGDDKMWKNESYYSNSPRNAYNINNSYTKQDMNDWLIAPPVRLQSGKKYQLRFFVRGIGTEIEKLSVHMANSSETGTLEGNKIITKEDINSTDYSKITYTITPTSTDDYFIAFKGYSSARTKGIAIDDFLVDELLENDLKINSLGVNNNSFIYENSNILFSAEVENNGANVINNKKVSLLLGGTEVASFTIDNIVPGQKEVVEFNYKVSKGVGQSFVCKIADDDNNANNEKSINIDVYQAGLLLEGFEGDEFPPGDKWTLENINGTGDNFMHYKSAGYNSDRKALLKAKYLKASEARLITPELSIKAGDKIEFYASSNNNANALVVEYTTDGTSFKQLSTITLTTDYGKKSVDLSAHAGKKIKVAFHGTTAAEYNAAISIDHITGPVIAGALKPKMTLSKALGGVAHEFDAFNLNGESQTFEVDIKNEGNAVLQLTKDNIKITGADAAEFAHNANLPLSISPQESFTLVVKSSPTSEGRKTAKLEIVDPQDTDNIRVKQFVATVNPAKPELKLPLNSQDEVALQPTLEWNTFSGDYTVDLYLSEATKFEDKDKVLNNTPFSASYKVTKNLKNGQRYFWQLVVKKTIGDVVYSTKSDVYNFTAVLGDNIVQIGKVDKVEKGLNSLPMSCGTDDLSYMTYSQSLYKKSEFSFTGKRIKQIFYYYNGVQEFEEDIVVYMANTDFENLSSANGWVPYKELEEVYRGKFNVPAVEGWVAIELPVAFEYDNTKNLVIGFDSNAKAIQNSNAGFYYLEDKTGAVTKYKRHHSIYGNPNPADDDQSGLLTNDKPIVRFGLENAPTQPIIYTTTKQIKFEKCGLFQRPVKQLELRNIGVNQLKITSVEIEGDNSDNFRLETPKTFAIEQGERATVKLRFIPDNEGVKSASLKIISEDNAVITIPLSAEAIDTEIKTFPFVEDFEDGVFPLPGWTNNEFWKLAGSGYESDHSLTCDFDRKDDAVLTTPAIALPKNHRLTFRWKNKYTPVERLLNYDFTYVEVSEDNGTNWTELNHFTIDKESFEYQKLIVDLSAYGDKKIKLRWRHSITNNSNGYMSMQAITIDDVTIEEIPYTPAVTNFNLEVQNDNDVRVSWDAPTMDPAKPKNVIEGYILYRNGKRVAKDLITDLYYVDQNLKRGEYEYVILVKYKKGESNLSMPDNIFIDIEEAFPVHNLDATVVDGASNKNVKLTWDKPIKKKTVKRFPSDDTYGPAKTGKYSQDQIWIANYAPKGHHEVGMFKFNLDGLSADKIDKVTLRLHQIFMANDYNTVPSKVYAISNNWNENDFDYSTKPVYDDSKVWAEYYFGSNGWQEIDITDLVKAWINNDIPNNGLCLVASEGDRLRVMDSKESYIAANRPHINIITEDDESQVTNPNHGKGIGYKVYRNDVEIAQVDKFETTEYTDENLKPDFYSYSVSAMYSKAGESEKCQPKIVNVSLNNESAWTWMVYLYEDGTGLDGAEDINELEVLGSVPGMINYIVLYDSDDDDKDGIYYVEKDPEGENNTIISKRISTQFGVDPRLSDWNVLSKFMRWTAEQFPARNYALTMWDHGNGIFRGEEAAVRSFVGNMNLWDMDKALKEFNDYTKKKLEIVGFDLCLLGQAETVYQLKDLTNYVIASEKTEPGDGWDYVTQFSALNENPMIEPDKLCKHMVEKYVESYSVGGNSNVADVTQAATNTKVFSEEVIPALNQFAGLLIDNLYEYKAEIKASRDLAWNSKRNVDHKDLGDFAKIISENKRLPKNLTDKASEFLTIYNKSIVATGATGKANETTTGLRIWIPEAVSAETENSKLYLDPVNYLRFSETLWDEFIFNYEKPQENPMRLEVAKTKYVLDPADKTLKIKVTKIGDGDVYWDIEQQSNWFDIKDTQLLNSNTVEISMDVNKGIERNGRIVISAAGVIGCPIKIEITQNTAIKPITVISATKTDNDVKLKWELPVSTVNPTAVIIYKKGKELTTITDIKTLTYTDSDLDEGSYTYYAVVKYGELKSEKSSDVAVNIINPAEFESFTAELKGKVIGLSWKVNNVKSFEAYNVFLNDKKISTIDDVNKTEYSYEYKDKGAHKFYVQLQYSNGKTLNSDYRTVNVEKIISGIDYSDSDKVKVYPNPVKNNLLFINTDNDIITKVELFTSDGKLVYSDKGDAKEIWQIDMSKMPEGYYFVRVTTNNGIRTAKIVKL